MKFKKNTSGWNEMHIDLKCKIFINNKDPLWTQKLLYPRARDNIKPAAQDTPAPRFSCSVSDLGSQKNPCAQKLGLEGDNNQNVSQVLLGKGNL